MEHAKETLWGWLRKKIVEHFLTGILIVAPIGATVLILVWVFVSIDNILQPVIGSLWGRTLTGVGFGVTIALIYLVGAIASNVLGKRVVLYCESLLSRIPLFRYLYIGIKQILESFSKPAEAGFLQVVLVEFPRKGIRSIGFVTNESSDEPGKKLLSVFVPTSPNPTSGFLQIVRENEIIRTNISVDDALKMAVSAGKISHKEIIDKFLMLFFKCGNSTNT